MNLRVFFIYTRRWVSDGYDRLMKKINDRLTKKINVRLMKINVQSQLAKIA